MDNKQAAVIADEILKATTKSFDNIEATIKKSLDDYIKHRITHDKVLEKLMGDIYYAIDKLGPIEEY